MEPETAPALFVPIPRWEQMEDRALCSNQSLIPVTTSITETSDGSDFTISKYVDEGIRFNLSTGDLQPNQINRTQRQNTTPNWVIYRYTDLLLMKAEALVMMTPEDTVIAADPEALAARNRNFLKAFDIVQATYQRALCTGYDGGYTNATADTLKFGDYSGSKLAMENLILQERRRELCFEGKRWFDLVRMARRDGNTTDSALVLVNIRKMSAPYA